jgi:hypothetical protein
MEKAICKQLEIKILIYLKKYLLFILSILISFTSISQSVVNHKDNELISLLKGKDKLIDLVLDNQDKYHLQINFTKVDANKNEITLHDYSLNKDKHYFHPASLIKLPIAITSLELFSKFEEDYGIDLNTFVHSETCSCDFNTDKYVNNKMRPNLDILLREMLIMSNNESYNFFFNFSGPTYFNRRMKELSLNNIILRNRFYAGCTYQGANEHGGLYFQKDNSSNKYKIGCIKDSLKTIEQSLYLNYPNSRSSNVVSLYSIHRLMIQLFYPQSFNPDFKLFLSSKNLDFLKTTLSSYPNSLPNYQNIPSHFHKYLMPSAFLNKQNNNIKIYSKNGNAGGYISDVMFLNDEEHHVKYFLSVSMLNYKQKSYYKRRVIYTTPGIDVFRKISNVLYEYAKKQSH